MLLTGLGGKGGIATVSGGFDADPDPNPTSHFDTDPEPNPDPSFQIKAQNLEKLCS
jgi:hypothetical protein